MIELHHGDCIEKMHGIESGSVDLILTDPPYGMTACKWDSVIPLDPMWGQLKRIIKPNGAIVMTASQPFTSVLICSNLKMFKYCWVWEKSHPSGVATAKKRVMKYHEDIVIFYAKQPSYYPQKTIGKPNHSIGIRAGKINKSESNANIIQKATIKSVMKHPKSVIKISNPNTKGQHPTQKPVALMEYLIKTYTNKGDIVLDFTMGSGTTGVAAHNLGRDFIGIEKEKKYFDIAEMRIREETAQQAMDI